MPKEGPCPFAMIRDAQDNETLSLRANTRGRLRDRRILVAVHDSRLKPEGDVEPSAEVRKMTLQEWERKVRELEMDHIAAGGFISREDAEKVVEEAHGPKPGADSAEASACDARRRN